MACPRCGWHTYKNRYCSKACAEADRKKLHPLRDTTQLNLDVYVWKPAPLNRDGLTQGHEKRIYLTGAKQSGV